MPVTYEEGDRYPYAVPISSMQNVYSIDNGSGRNIVLDVSTET